MRYFTRELFDAMQLGPGESDTGRAITSWQQNVSEYRAALNELKPRLLSGFAWLADTTLHDGVITGLDTAASDEIVLTVDASYNPWGQTGTVILRFEGIQSSSGLENCVDDVWLYEELHECEDAHEVCVLLETGEIRIAAKSLTVACEL
ncbi:MAG: DUF4085 family protein [Aureliella sp.]